MAIQVLLAFWLPLVKRGLARGWRGKDVHRDPILEDRSKSILGDDGTGFAPVCSCLYSLEDILSILLAPMCFFLVPLVDQSLAGYMDPFRYGSGCFAVGGAT